MAANTGAVKTRIGILADTEAVPLSSLPRSEETGAFTTTECLAALRECRWKHWYIERDSNRRGCRVY